MISVLLSPAKLQTNLSGSVLSGVFAFGPVLPARGMEADLVQENAACAFPTAGKP